jgi:hypothetical protein
MKKILALVLALAMVCAMLVSCGEDAKAILKKADEALQNTPYVMTMKMNFESDNEDVNKIFSLMEMEIPVTIDGKNVALDMSMDVMGYTASIELIIADMVVYYDMSVLGQSVKMKANMNDEQYQEFMEENNTEMVVNPEDFSEITLEVKDGKKYIACAKINEEGIKELNDMMKDFLGEDDASIAVSDITYGVTLKDGKYESMELSCVYAITVGTESYNITMNLGSEFSYDNVKKITAPADADKYQSVDFDELLG